MYIIYSHTCTFKHVDVQSYIQTCTCTKYNTFKHVHVHNIQSYIQTYTCT